MSVGWRSLPAKLRSMVAREAMPWLADRDVGAAYGLARRIVEAWEAENELAVEEEVERISDHEVMEWYAKMYGRGMAEK